MTNFNTQSDLDGIKRPTSFTTHSVGNGSVPARHPRVSLNTGNEQQSSQAPANKEPHRKFFKKNTESDQTSGRQSKPKRSLRRRLAIYGSALVGLLVIFFLAFGVFKISSIGGDIFTGNNGDGPGFFEQLTAFTKPGAQLKGEDDGQVNVLFIGVGGENHPGGTLADTIMVASVRPTTGEVALLSIPRDVFIPTTYSKINAVHAYAEQQAEGSGPGALADVVEDITGLEIPYYIRADFEGFHNAINNIGGIDINVPTAFYDELHDIYFEAGPQFFDGRRALYYVRSRYISGVEGSDFARAARAQIVLEAVQGKLMALNPVTDIGKISGIMQDFGEHIRTNLTPSEVKRIYEITRNVGMSNIVNKVLDNADTKLLYGDSVDMGGVASYILRPVGGNWDQIRVFVANLFTHDWLTEEDPSVDVLNGSSQVGLAGNFGRVLAEKDFTVNQIENALTKDHLTTYIIDTTGGKKSHTLSTLISLLEKQGNILVETKTSDLESAGYTSDFIVVLGADFISTQ